ncbi:MMPL family transporter [Virgisporangium aliadipatigenens]|nr:MMPL family transporter [Virgisporangium aliadipatigenens]
MTRIKYLVVLLWMVVLGVAGPFAVKLTEVQENDALGALPAEAEAHRAAERVKNAFPDSRAPVAVAVYVRESGLTDADRARVEADRTAFARYADGGAVGPATPSGDGRALLFGFPVAGDDDVRAAAVSAMKARLTTPDGALAIALTGAAAAEDDVFDAFEGMDTALLAATAVTVSLLLLVTYRSPVLWLVPLVTVAVAAQSASALVYLLAKHAGVAVDFQSQSILTVLVFGVGVDYALLLISRYREELRVHEDRHRAMAVAVRRSIGAIAASAATVGAGLLCLLAAVLPSTRGIGPVGAVGVLCAFLAMTTLLPALLVLCGRWLFWPFVPRVGVVVRASGWARVADLVGRRPRTVWLASAAVLGALTLGITNLSVGLPNDRSFTTEVGSVRGQRLIAAHYPGGTVSPAEVVTRAASGDAVAAAARAVPGVVEVSVPEKSPDGAWARIRVTLADTPDSDAALSTVDRLRRATHAVPGAAALVGGFTAEQLDNETAVDRDNRVVMPLILLVVFGILVALLRALVAPLLLMASVVVSYAAALGAAGFILNAMGHPDLYVALPLQAFLFLVALGVDYTIFLMTRAREEAAARGHHAGIRHALAVTGGVITSAGVVLAATFAALGVLPLVGSVQTGVIVGVGVLLDTFLVRSLLVPALALHVGRRTWWPGRLASAPAPVTAAAREPATV